MFWWIWKALWLFVGNIYLNFNRARERSRGKVDQTVMAGFYKKIIYLVPTSMSSSVSESRISHNILASSGSLIYINVVCYAYNPPPTSHHYKTGIWSKKSHFIPFILLGFPFAQARVAIRWKLISFLMFINSISIWSTFFWIILQTAFGKHEFKEILNCVSC